MNRSGPRNEAARISIAARFRDRPAADALSRDPSAVLSQGRAVPGGRGEHRLLPAEDWGVVVRVRPGRRGGLLAALRKNHYASPNRALREHALVEALHSEGLPVVAPAFALAWRAGAGWRTAVATVERSEASDLAAFLDTRPGEADRVVAARAIAANLRRLHDAGVRHGDLQVRNLLLEPNTSGDAFSCIAIDFDRADRGPALSPAARIREWARLMRSCEKTGQAAALSPRVAAAALGTYCDGDRSLRRALLARWPTERARLRRHRLGWWRRGDARVAGGPR